MKVAVIGGTGFLGHHAVLELLRRGHQASSLSLRDVALGAWHPREVPAVFGDVFAMPRAELVPLLHGHDALVYAVGPDDRIVPPAPALDYFRDRLVLACAKVISAARDAGVRRCVVLGSYFAHFARAWPQLRLAEHHPYIRCRLEQEDAAIAAGGDAMVVCVLELPFIFGTAPGRVPLWEHVLIDHLRGPWPVMFPRGGTNMISVQHVAEAIAGAVERGRHGARYLVGDENLSWRQMLSIMLQAMGRRDRVLTIPTVFATWFGRLTKWRQALSGREAGLNPAMLFQDLLAQETCFDPVPAAAELGHGRGGLAEAIRETVHACMTR